MAQTRKYLAPEPNEFMVSTVNVLRSAYMVLASISVIQLWSMKKTKPRASNEASYIQI